MVALHAWTRHARRAQQETRNITIGRDAALRRPVGAARRSYLKREFSLSLLRRKRFAGVVHFAPDGGRRYNEVANIRYTMSAIAPTNQADRP